MSHGTPGPPPTPAVRIGRANDAPIASGGDFVLYWMTASRRTRWNFALQRAVEHGNALGLPLLVLEPLRAGYRWACDRFHRFVTDGMVDNQARLKRRGVAYHPYVEPVDGAGKGLLEALAARAAVVVTDDYPAFFLPRMVRSAGPRLPVRLEAVEECVDEEVPVDHFIVDLSAELLHPLPSQFAGHCHAAPPLTVRQTR